MFKHLELCKRERADLAVILLDNYFKWLTAGGTALHRADERHPKKTVDLSLIFSPHHPLAVSFLSSSPSVCCCQSLSLTLS